MDTCLNIEKFKQDLLNVINTCNLSINMAYYVLLSITNMVESEYRKLYYEEQNKSQINNEVYEFDSGLKEVLDGMVVEVETNEIKEE